MCRLTKRVMRYAPCLMTCRKGHLYLFHYTGQDDCVNVWRVAVSAATSLAMLTAHVIVPCHPFSLPPSTHVLFARAPCTRRPCGGCDECACSQKEVRKVTTCKTRRWVASDPSLLSRGRMLRRCLFPLRHSLHASLLQNTSFLLCACRFGDVR